MLIERKDSFDSSRTHALVLRGLMSIEGFVGCAVADMRSGQLLVGESHERGLDLARTAAVLADTLRSQQDAALALGCTAPVEETVLCAGPDQFVVRPLSKATQLFIFAKLDHARANLTLARVRLAEAQHALA